MTATNELTCQELVELVTDYLENTLPAADRARFEAHLAICRGCTAYLAQMRLTIRQLHRLADDVLTPAARADLLRAFRGWNAGR